MRSIAELVAAAQAADRTAFAELVGRYERVAIASAWAVVGDYHAAQDVAQESFVIAYGRLKALRRAEAFGPWLLKIVRREATRRASRTRRMISMEDVAEGPAVPTERGWNEHDDGVIKALSRLPEQERIVVMFRYLDALSVNEIAAETGRPVGTVTKQLSRAVERLRAWLKPKVQS